MPPDSDTLSHSYLFCWINFEGQEENSPWCGHPQLSARVLLLFVTILSTLINPAFVPKSRDLLIIKNESFPTSKPQVDKKLTRRESPEEQFIPEKFKYTKINWEWKNTTWHKRGQDRYLANHNHMQWSVGKSPGVLHLIPPNPRL